MVRYLPSAIALLLAIVCAGAAMHEPRSLACDRTTCTWGDRTFRVADVREVRFVEGFGKSKRQAESQLIFASGHQISLGRADTDDARATFHMLRTFFAPDGPPALTMQARSMKWMWLAVAGCVVAAVVLGVRAKKEPEIYRAPEQRRADWKKRKRYILLGAGALAAIGGLQLALVLVASTVQGTLVLECKQRCRFQGIECLPGGSSRQTLDEGTYQIDIWAAAGSALWIPKTFTITTGETTTFVCE